MKYIKKFENSRSPQLNDYVICKEDPTFSIPKYIENFVGKIFGYHGKYFKVRFRKGLELIIPPHDIVYFSESPIKQEEIDLYISQNKYNI
jgi:hypothetical protein